jgi:hypothetical protein
VLPWRKLCDSFWDSRNSILGTLVHRLWICREKWELQVREKRGKIVDWDNKGAGSWSCFKSTSLSLWGGPEAWGKHSASVTSHGQAGSWGYSGIQAWDCSFLLRAHLRMGTWKGSCRHSHPRPSLGTSPEKNGLSMDPLVPISSQFLFSWAPRPLNYLVPLTTKPSPYWEETR